MSDGNIIALNYKKLIDDQSWYLMEHVVNKSWGNTLILLKHKGKVTAHANLVKNDLGVQMCFYRNIEYQIIIKRVRRQKLFNKSFAPFFTEKNGTVLSFNFTEMI